MLRVEPVEESAQHTCPAAPLLSQASGTAADCLVLVAAGGGVGELVVAHCEPPGAWAARQDGEQHPQAGDQIRELAEQPQHQELEAGAQGHAIPPVKISALRPGAKIPTADM